MLKLRFSKPFIKTYNDGKVTVCRYNCTLIDSKTKRVTNEFSVTGTAKCSPNDVVDESYGRKLADSRAKYEAYKSALDYVCPGCYEDMVSSLETLMGIVDFVDMMKYLKTKEREHIQFIKENI